MANPDQWARNLEKEISESREEQANQAATLRVKYELIKVHGPQLWDETLAAFGVFCEAYNKNKAENSTALVFTQLNAHNFMVRFDGNPHEVLGRYDWESRSIGINGSVPGLANIYDPKVSMKNDGEVLLFSRNDGQPVLPSDIARKSLETFVKQMRS